MMLQNLATLLSHLNNKVDIFRSPHAMFSHIDFVWAKDVKELVNNVVLSIFASKSKSSLSGKCVRRWHLFARRFSSDCKDRDDKKHHYNKSAKILNVQTTVYLKCRGHTRSEKPEIDYVVLGNLVFVLEFFFYSQNRLFSSKLK